MWCAREYVDLFVSLRRDGCVYASRAVVIVFRNMDGVNVCVINIQYDDMAVWLCVCVRDAFSDRLGSRFEVMKHNT